MERRCGSSQTELDQSQPIALSKTEGLSPKGAIVANTKFEVVLAELGEAVRAGFPLG